MNTNTRWHFLDGLRIFGILAVFLFHNNHFFDHFGWEVKAVDRYMASSLITAAMAYWLMPLFFLIAGAATMFALRKRSYGSFLKERLLRLLLPCLLCALVMTPPQRYVQALYEGKNPGSFLSFVPENLKHMWIDTALGSMKSPDWFGHIGTHLWFLGTLFLMSLCVVPIIAFCRTPRVTQFLQRMGNLCAAPGGLTFLLLVLIAVRVLVRPLSPKYNEWGDFAYWGTIYLFGVALASDPRLIERIRRLSWGALALAIPLSPAIALFQVFGDLGHYMDHPGYDRGSLLFHAYWGLMTSLWLVALVGLGKRSLDRDTPRRRMLSEYVMPFYIVHQTPILVIGYFWVTWPVSPLVRFGAITTASLAATVVAVAVVSHVPALRFMFGMHANQAQTKIAPPEVPRQGIA